MCHNVAVTMWSLKVIIMAACIIFWKASLLLWYHNEHFRGDLHGFTSGCLPYCEGMTGEIQIFALIRMYVYILQATGFNVEGNPNIFECTF